MADHKVAMLTAGGLAPCLSSAVGGLIERYSEIAPEIEIIGYLNGYAGLLRGRSIAVTDTVRQKADILHRHGGSPLGNSRVKLTNVADCEKRGLIEKGADPLRVAAERLASDGITILHTIGGDDTNMTAADLATFLAAEGYNLTVVGLPKTIDNDIVPIRQSLGGWTAAEQGAIYFENIVNEQSTSTRAVVVHEVMGRNCGWLTAATAATYRERLKELDFLPEFNLAPGHKDIDAVYVPEMAIDIDAEAARLRARLDEKDCVNIVLSEGAYVDTIVREMIAGGQAVERDPFGHVKIDRINVGDWFSKRFTALIGAERALVQKSGYFARSAAPNDRDLRLIRSMVATAVDAALAGQPGVVGHDEEHDGDLRPIAFERIRGGKHFDPATDWFVRMLDEIGQPRGAKTAAQPIPD